MPKVLRLPARNKVKPTDTWDLAPLCESDAQWEEMFQKLDKMIAGYAKFRGKLGESAKMLSVCLKFDSDFDRLGERVGGYAHLKATEDQANSTYQAMVARFSNLATRASQAASYIRPEILALPQATLEQFLASRDMAPWKLVMERIVRYKPYTLSEREEEILAMQGEMAEAAKKAFRQLLDADMKFGLVRGEEGENVEM
jgi:oligoendopeptidase F